MRRIATTLSLLVVIGLAPALPITPAATAAGAPVTAPSAGPRAGDGTVAVLLNAADGRPVGDRMRPIAALVGHDPATARAQLDRLLPTAGQRQAVQDWATAHGLRSAPVGDLVVNMYGDPQRLAALFDTGLTTATGNDGKPHRATTRPLTVPAQLRDAASAALGLDERPVFRQHTAPATSCSGPYGLAPCSSSFDPTTLRSHYGITRAGSDGSGITIATVQFAGWDSSTLSTWAAQYGLTVGPTQVQTITLPGADPTAISAGSLEVSMDQEALLAVAPKATQRIYFGVNTDAGITDVYSRLASDAAAGLVQVASTSWGACEPQVASFSNPDTLTAYVEAVVAGGATLFAATGDSGAYDCANPTPGASEPDPLNQPWVDFPASDPLVVATGGTAITSGVEGGWSQRPAPYANCPDSYCGQASGGGESQVFYRPGYQSPYVPANYGRLVPDVASLAGLPLFNVYTHDDGGTGWVRAGGTSLAAPTWAGALAGALSSGAYGRSSGDRPGIGDIHATLYGAPAGSFRDITSCDPATNNPCNFAFNTATGYDLVTGLGVPNWTVLAPAISPTPGPKSLFHGLPTPTRIFKQTIGAGQDVPVQITGKAGVPSNATAVVFTLTGANATANSDLRVHPTGTPIPYASVVNPTPGRNTPNLVTARIGSSGRVSIYNHTGSVLAIVDVLGYYVGTASGGAGFSPVTPMRILKTADGVGAPKAPVAAGQELTFTVPNVPAGANAVAVNLTGYNSSGNTDLRLYPAGQPTPTISQLNLVAGEIRADAVVVQLPSNHQLTVYSSSASVQVAVDVDGFFVSSGGSAFTPVDPVRVFDTRSGLGSIDSNGPTGPTSVGKGQTVTMLPSGLPPGTTAVAFDLLGAGLSGTTYGVSDVRAWPDGQGMPNVSNLNIYNGENRPNFVHVGLGGGNVELRNSDGTIRLIADLSGYFGP